MSKLRASLPLPERFLFSHLLPTDVLTLLRAEFGDPPLVVLDPNASPRRLRSTVRHAAMHSDGVFFAKLLSDVTDAAVLETRRPTGPDVREELQTVPVGKGLLMLVRVDGIIPPDNWFIDDGIVALDDAYLDVVSLTEQDPTGSSLRNLIRPILAWLAEFYSAEPAVTSSGACARWPRRDCGRTATNPSATPWRTTASRSPTRLAPTSRPPAPEARLAPAT